MDFRNVFPSELLKYIKIYDIFSLIPHLNPCIHLKDTFLSVLYVSENDLWRLQERIKNRLKNTKHKTPSSLLELRCLWRANNINKRCQG